MATKQPHKKTPHHKKTLTPIQNHVPVLRKPHKSKSPSNNPTSAHGQAIAAIEPEKQGLRLNAFFNVIQQCYILQKKWLRMRVALAYVPIVWLNDMQFTLD